MDPVEEQYKKDLEAAGVDLPDLKKDEGETPEQKAANEAKAKEDADAKAAAEAEEAAKKAAEEAEGEGEDDQPPKVEKKRSIYDDLKDKKTEARSLKNIAIDALKALGIETSGKETTEELQEKLQSISKAKTPEEKSTALDEFDEFAKEIDADPVALRKMRELFLKGFKVQEIDPSLKERLENFEKWEAGQKKQLDESAFEEEFTATLPTLKEMFPKATDDEIKAIKGQLKKISHSTGWNDKELEYIAFKHKDALTALVSPKKKGLEGKDPVGEGEITTEFDPNPDFSKMSDKAREIWEKQYKEASDKGRDGLMEGADGKKLIL